MIKYTEDGRNMDINRGQFQNLQETDNDDEIEYVLQVWTIERMYRSSNLSRTVMSISTADFVTCLSGE